MLIHDLYEWALSQKLPGKDFKWLRQLRLYHQFIIHLAISTKVRFLRSATPFGSGVYW
jgi:hypothetical protein